MLIRQRSGTVLVNRALGRLLGRPGAALDRGVALWGERWPGLAEAVRQAAGEAAERLVSPDLGLNVDLPFRCTRFADDRGDEAVLAAAEVDAERILSDAADAVQRTLAAKARFLATASHDLRQPFQAMRLFLGALMGRLTEERQIKIARQLSAAMEAGDKLLGALLDISTLDAGTVTPQPEMLELSRLVRSLVDEFAPQAEDKGLALRARTATVHVVTDPVLLSRVLRNLIANAIHYTRHGKILVALRHPGASVAIEVWDTGPGIPEDQQKIIFEEFTQLDNPARQAGRGLGLGLAIVRRLAALLGARVEVRSRPGRGSVFRVVLPAAERTPEPADGPAEAAPQADLDGVAALVVEDNPMVLQGLETTLEGWGCRVYSATNMAEVMRRLDALPDGPDLLLSDLRLPGGITGFDVLDRVDHLYRRRVPTVVLTGETGREPLLEGERRGIAFLHKPLSTDGIRRAIAEVLRPR